MKVSVNKLPKGLAELTVELSPEELKPYLEQAAAGLSAETPIPGFRPGKAPYGIAEKRFGSMKICQAAGENIIQKTYVQAVRDNNLPTIGQPEISLEKIAPNNPFIYKAKVALLPEVKLGDYKKIKISKKEVKVEGKEVQETLANLRKMFGKEKKKLRPIAKGDKVEIDMDTYVDKVPIDGGTSKNHPVVIGESHFIPGFEDSLLGLSEGESKEFQLNFPKNYHRKDLAGKPVEFKVKINNVFEIELPELNDDFARQVGKFEKIDDLREQIEKNIHREKAGKEKQRRELEIIQKIIEKSEFGEIPELLIESELHKMLHELEHQVTAEGMKFDDYLSSLKKTKDDLKKEFREQAIKQVKTALILRQIAETEKIEVSDEEVKKEIEANKKQYQGNEEILKQVDTEDYRYYLKNMMRSQKVVEWLHRNCG